MSDQVHLICLYTDISSTPGAIINEVVGAFTDKGEAKKECQRLNDKLEKELMEEHDLSDPEELEDLYDLEYDGFDLSSPPHYSVVTKTLK